MSIHTGVRCDGCKLVPIVGMRHKCLMCQDFDFCDNCKNNTKHEPSHRFLEIANYVRNKEWSNIEGTLCQKCTEIENSGVLYCASCGNCKYCSRLISYSAYSLCGECSNEHNLCYKCGNNLPIN